MSSLKTLSIGCATVGLLGALTATFPRQAIAQSCVAQTSCPASPIQVTPGSWIEFEIINRTGNIISLEQPNATDPIALSPGQKVTLSGSTVDNVSLLFWDIQGISLEARVKEISKNHLQVELLWGNSFGHYSLYLKDDGRVELL
ncbi:MAG: hypothetical protein HC799_12305 [Limnothrix sp. RL_2_0]|nr:hypothetical protein [Limnothrix sp. RL_2_0]